MISSRAPDRVSFAGVGGRPASPRPPLGRSTHAPPGRPGVAPWATAREPSGGRRRWSPRVVDPSRAEGVAIPSSGPDREVRAIYEAPEEARRDAPEPGREGRGPGAAGGRPAVFLDRDGTVIEQVHYLSDPDKVRLLPGAAAALRRLRGAGFALVAVTNQSAIGRGWITVAQYEAVNEAMARQLAAEGVALDAIYYCPEVPAVDDRTAVTHGDRKPGPGMLLRAADDLGIDLAASWMVGDMISDALAGVNAGCKGSILVETGKGLAEDEARALGGTAVVSDLSAAADMILGPPAGAGRDDRSESPRDRVR